MVRKEPLFFGMGTFQFLITSANVAKGVFKAACRDNGM